MKDVLICCTNAEGSQLQWLAKALLDTGWSVTFMHKGSRGVSSANCVIAVWSPNSIGDDWLASRAKAAAKRRRLVSVRLGGVRPPRGLRSEQVVDLSEWPARGADHAITTLLGSVEAVANGTGVRTEADGNGRLRIGLIVGVMLMGGAYAVYRLAAVPSVAGRVDADRVYSEAAIRAADNAAAAEHAMRNAANGSENRAEGEEAVAAVDGGTASSMRMPESSDAARLGAQALNQLTAALDGADLPLEDIRRTAADALALDPLQPHARATFGVLRGLADLQWDDANQYMKTLDSGSSDPGLAAVVGAYRRWLGDAAPASLDAIADPLCDIADDGAFAEAIIELDGARRLSLLERGCVVERVHERPEVRMRLGIVQR